MQFEWDQNKNKLNLEKHRIGFEEASLIFDGPILTMLDNRKEYHEIREKSIGAIQDIIVATVVHTKRNSCIRIISARKANTKEREAYYEYIKKEAR